MPGIAVISNPHSRENVKDPSVATHLGHLLGNAGSPYATRSVDEIYRAAEASKASGIEILGIHGGDGTLHVTLSAFAQVYGDEPLPKIALLPGGTLNTVATGIGLRGEAPDVLERVMGRVQRGDTLRTIQRNALRINDKVGFIFGNGLVASFLGAYYATGRPSPLMGAWLVLRTCASAIFRTPFGKNLFRRWRGQVAVDGVPWEREDFLTVTAATVPEIGLGFKPFTRAIEKPDHFAVLGIHTTPFGLTLEVPRIHRGEALPAKKAESAIGQTLDVASDGPFPYMPYMIDGEIYPGSRELRVEIGPRLDLILP